MSAVKYIILCFAIFSFSLLIIAIIVPKIVADERNELPEHVYDTLVNIITNISTFDSFYFFNFFFVKNEQKELAQRYEKSSRRVRFKELWRYGSPFEMIAAEERRKALAEVCFIDVH